MASNNSASKISSQQEKFSAAIEDARKQLQAATSANLGLFGKAYDQIQERVTQLREEAPKQWESIVQRGEQLQQDVSQKVDSSDFSIKIDMQAKREQLNTVIEKMKDLVAPAKAA